MFVHAYMHLPRLNAYRDMPKSNVLACIYIDMMKSAPTGVLQNVDPIHAKGAL